MGASVVSFLRRALNQDWSAQELAEFYRVEAALLQAGVHVVSDRGLTDEGDPWFVFCRDEDEEVIIHFARIGGQYLINAPSYGTHATGRDFRVLVRELVERHKALQPLRRSAVVSYHPSSLLVVLVASALLKAGYAHAAEVAPAARPAPASGGSQTDVPGPRISIAQLEHALDIIERDFPQTAAALSVATFAAVLPPPPVPSNVATQPVETPRPSSHGPSIPAQLNIDHVTASPDAAGSALPAAAPLLNGELLINHNPHDSDSNAAGMSPAPAGSSKPGVGLAAQVLSPANVQAPHVIDIAASHVGGELAQPTALLNVNDLAATVLHDLGNGEPILYFKDVPGAFNVPLHQSTHIDQVTVGPAPHETVGLAAPATIAVPSLGSSATTASAPSEGGVTGTGGSNLSIENALPSPAVTHTTSAVPGAGLSMADLGTVLNLVQTFSQEVGSHLAVVVTPAQVIAYDAYAIDHAPATVSAVTYDFVDGSSISLVGVPSELPHLHF